MFATTEDVSRGRFGVGKGRRLSAHNGSSFVGLLFSGLGHEKVVVGLDQVELSHSQLGTRILQLTSEVRDQGVGVVKSRESVLVFILGGGEVGEGSVVDLGGQVEGISCSIDHQVGLGLLIEGVGEYLLCVGVGVECQIVDILGVQGSSQSSLGILGSLTGLGFSVDEGIVGSTELVGSNLKLLLGRLEIVFGVSHNTKSVVHISSSQFNNLIGSLEDFVSAGRNSISSGSVSSGLLDLVLGVVILRSSHLEGQSGLGIELSRGVNVLLLLSDDLDGCVDCIGGSQLLLLDLVDVVLNWNITVGDLNQIGS